MHEEVTLSAEEFGAQVDSVASRLNPIGQKVEDIKAMDYHKLRKDLAAIQAEKEMRQDEIRKEQRALENECYELKTKNERLMVLLERAANVDYSLPVYEKPAGPAETDLYERNLRR